MELGDKIKDDESRIILDKVELSHLDLILRWFNDKEISRFMDDEERYTKGKTPNYKLDDLKELLNPPKTDIYYVIKYGGSLIGFAQIYDISNNSGEFSFLIGDPSSRGKGLGKKIVSGLCEKAKENNLNKLICSVNKQNLPSIKSVEKNNFEEVSRTETEIFYKRPIN